VNFVPFVNFVRNLSFKQLTLMRDGGSHKVHNVAGDGDYLEGIR
jgi:hypothetical protein